MSDGFEKIFIGNIKGERGEQGIQGLKGDIADVTPQALYEHSVSIGFAGSYEDWLREYLNVQTDLPWVTGVFQDRSLPKEDLAVLTPIVQQGDESLISGDTFVAPSNGIYHIYTTPGRTTNGGGGNRLQSIIFKNTTAWLDPALVSLHDQQHSILPSAAYTGWLYEGEFLARVVFAVGSSASTICQSGLTPKFTFMKLR